MQIVNIQSSEEFETLTEDFRTLDVWSFGPLNDLNEADKDDNISVLVAKEDNEVVAYLIAQDNELWHVESAITGKGYAKRLAEYAEINFAYEVCSEDGANFCEALNIEFDDCR